MYQRYFELTERPFSETPNGKMFFLSPQHREGLAHLEYNILDGKGFTILVGEVGTGKTTICKALMDRLDAEKIKVVHIINTNLDFPDFLRELVEELGLSSEGLTKWELLRQFKEYLIESFGRNQKVVLIIDEAQNLEPAVLEGIRMLSNLETAQEKLIQIILVGQPGLMELIQRKDLLQLKQRISGYFYLGPLSEKETKDYIQFRMSAVQSRPALQFTSEAIALIYRKTKGVPRLINFLCDYSLRRAFVAGVWIIEPEMVQKAFAEIKGSVQLDDEGGPEERIEPLNPSISFGKEKGPTAKLHPFLIERPQNQSIQEEPAFIIPEEEPFYLPEKKSKLKRFAVVLGLVLTLGGLGSLWVWEQPLNSWAPSADLPAYTIKIPVTDADRDLQFSQPLAGQNLSKFDPRVKE
jgi:type II secretory pathway predicted ATPase ExeA